jgi:hypothetical protein
MKQASTTLSFLKFCRSVSKQLWIVGKIAAYNSPTQNITASYKQQCNY